MTIRSSHGATAPAYIRPSTLVRFAVQSVVVSLSTLTAVDAFAQQADSTNAVTLDPVVVTATRSPERVSDLVAEVTVLNRADLDRYEGRTLVEVLAQTPGLQLSSNGGLGNSSSLYVRGLEARHVLLLIDGVRVGSATLNTASLDNLPLDTIERIEIVRGPMSSLYGSNAMAGVVQIFTRKGKIGVSGNARVGVGSDGYGIAAGGINYGTSTFDLNAQVQRQQTEGFSTTNPTVRFGNHNPDDDGFRQNAGSLRAGWNINSNWRLDGLWLESQGRTQYDDGPDGEARADLLTRVLSLQLDGQVTERWRTKFAVGRSTDIFDVRASARGPTRLGAIRTDQTQISLENSLELPLGEALFLVERIEQDVDRESGAFAVNGRTIDAFALGWSGSVGPHDWSVSMRRDRNSQFGGKTTGALAYAWEFAPRWNVGGSWGTSFTAPSFNQLYFPGFGNPDLLPEEGKHGELFVAWRAGAHNFRLTGFEHRYDGFISGGPQPSNIPTVRIRGTSLAWDATVQSAKLSASYDHLEPINTTTGSNNEGKLLPRRAEQSIKFGADWALQNWTLGGSLVAYSHRYDNTANTIRLAGYAVIDLRADRKLSREWTLGIRLNNVADKPYETAFGFNQAGRQGFITLRWNQR